MSKKRLRQISPMRLGIVLGAMQGLLGLLFVPFMLFAGGIAAYLQHTLPGVPWVFFGAGALFMPLVNTVAGFLAGVLFASAYNLVARWTGGIEIVLEDLP
ncbi:MAG: hypothetical protein HY302_13045 [Opitutae bacterium]|nr:hypothetical protein [Opitutae bacterium]